MASVLQKFYCHRCQLYLRVRLNMALNQKIKIVCPGCGRQHPRVIENGRITENGRDDEATNMILVPKSATSKEPLGKAMKKAAKDNTNPRGGEPLKDEALATSKSSASWVAAA